jgi:hypothetical protein
MTYRLFFGLLLSGLVIFSSCDSSSDKSDRIQEKDYYVAAYIWPSCHDEARSREVFWGEGI